MAGVSNNNGLFFWVASIASMHRSIEAIVEICPSVDRVAIQICKLARGTARHSHGAMALPRCSLRVVAGQFVCIGWLLRSAPPPRIVAATLIAST